MTGNERRQIIWRGENKNRKHDQKTKTEDGEGGERGCSR
jgi:hypothetical protein